MATTSYRYLFADLLTNEIIGELPLTGVSFNQQLNQAGTLQGHLLLSGMNTAEFNVSASTIPGRTALYVDRNDVLIWGGIIWGRDYSSTAQTIALSAREFESYFERRRITTTQDFSNTDQLVIARTLIDNAQSTPEGNIGVITNSETSGILVDRVYYDYELKGVYSALQDLSRQEDGFDFNISVDYDPVTFEPIKTLVLGYPRTGTVYSSTNAAAPVFIFPAGNIVEYEYPEDGAIAANTVYALGAGSNEGKLISVAQAGDLLLDGWPLLEEQANYSDITDATVLDELAIGQVNAVAYPPTTIKVVVPAFVNPELGTYDIGDDCRLIITDERFPSTLDAVYRIVGLNVQPGEDGPERVTLTLTETTN
jgi:hypothetical protein